jgi:hypothetical protein
MTVTNNCANETTYLLSVEANATRLRRSIAKHKAEAMAKAISFSGTETETKDQASKQAPDTAMSRGNPKL